MKNPFFFIFIFIAIILSTRCQKDINIKIQNYDGQLVIECILYPGKVPQLFLSTSTPFFSNSSTPQQLFARGAQVSIIGPAGTDSLAADSSFDNFRCRWNLFYRGNIQAQVGGTYNLSVTYAGKTYTATTTISQSQVQIQNSGYVYNFHDIYGDHEGVVVSFTDAAGSGNNYRYQMSRMIDSSVYGASNLGAIHSTCTNGNSFYVREIGRSVYSDKNLDGQSITITVEPAYTHQQDDTGYVFIQSIDTASAQFYDELDKQKLAMYNPFIEPVFIKSHINGCLGVFGSAVVSDSVLFVYPE